MQNIQMLGKFQLEKTLGRSIQVQASAMTPFSASVDECEVHVQLVPSFTPTPEASSVWVGGFDLTIRLSDLNEAGQRKAFEVMVNAAGRITDHLRILQPTSGLAGTRPRTNWVNIMVDGQTRPLCFDWYSDYRESATVLYQSDLQPDVESLQQAIAGEPRPDMDLEIYLAQARHFATFNSDSNPSLAVYLAALVCELKIKRALRRSAPHALLPELEVIIPVSDPATKQIPSLFSSVSKTYLGRSLKSDNKALLVRVTELFDLRNNFTHKATEIPLAKALECAATARRAVRWVDKVESEAPIETEGLNTGDPSKPSSRAAGDH